MSDRIVCFDLETGGLDPQKHPIIQFAGVAVDADTWEEIDSLECKLAFRLETAEPEALEVNNYNPEVWKKEEISPKQAVSLIDAFLRRHSTTEKVSKRGNAYLVAQLMGHNAATFDCPFLMKLFKDHGAFLAGTVYECLDTLHLARWISQRDRVTCPALGHSLEVLCERWDVALVGAHDALADVRATAELGRKLMEQISPEEVTR